MKPSPDNRTKEEVRASLENIRHPFDVAVCSSDNYFNFGNIVRTCHNFLGKKLYAVDMPSYYRKADMATRKFESINKVDMETFLKISEGRNIVAFERRANLDSKSILGYKYPEYPILFFGSEKTGVPDIILERAKDIVTIPVFGVHNDFNVAASAAIVMYDFINKFYNHKG